MGWVYIAKNPSIPNLIKIGMTERENPLTRVEELNSTGVPEPFSIEFAILVEDASALEGLLHTTYSHCRVALNREFFRLTASCVLKDLDSIVEKNQLTLYRLEIFNRELETREPSYESRANWGDTELITHFLTSKNLNKSVSDYISKHLPYVPICVIDESLLLCELIRAKRLHYMNRQVFQKIVGKAKLERFNTIIHLLLIPPRDKLLTGLKQSHLSFTEPISLQNGASAHEFLSETEKINAIYEAENNYIYDELKGFYVKLTPSLHLESDDQASKRVSQNDIDHFLEELSFVIFDTKSDAGYEHRMYLYFLYEKIIFKTKTIMMGLRDMFLSTEHNSLGYYLSGDVICSNVKRLYPSGANSVCAKVKQVDASYISIFDASFVIFFEATLEAGVSENDVARFCKKLVNERSSLAMHQYDAINFLFLLSRIATYCIQRYDGYRDERPHFDVSVIPRALRNYVSSEKIVLVHEIANGKQYFPFSEEARWEYVLSITDCKTEFRSGNWLHSS